MALGDTNTIGLDDGHCGPNLRIGVANFCPVAAPTCLLYGDGGMPTYYAIWDGVEIQTVVGGTGHYVCLPAPAALPDGPHTVSARELTPNPGKAVIPFSFVIDTHIPAAPVIKGIASYSDTLPPVGDNVTNWRTPTIEGTAEKLPNSSIQLYMVPAGGGPPWLVGGAAVNADGTWRVGMNSLQDGEYDVIAKQQTRSGNKSDASATYHFVISQTAPDPTPTPPPLPAAPTGVTASRSVLIKWAAVATATGYRVYAGPQGNEATLLVELAGTSTEWTHQNASPGLYYRVQAGNAAGWGPYSASV